MKVLNFLFFLTLTSSVYSAEIEITQDINLRSSPSFIGRENIGGVLLKGAKAQVVKHFTLPSGVEAYQIKVSTVLPSNKKSILTQGESFWVYGKFAKLGDIKTETEAGVSPTVQIQECNECRPKQTAVEPLKQIVAHIEAQSSSAEISADAQSIVNSLKNKGIICNLNPGEISVRGIQCKGKVESYPEPVRIYIPKNYIKGSENSFNVFFHGFESSVNLFQVNKNDTNGMGDFGARLSASEKNNGILVVPESRGLGVTYQKYFQDGTGKNFEIFKNQLEQLTENKFSKITLSGHSGGYLPLTALLKYPSVGGRVKRAALFDGTYLTSYPITDWLNKNPQNKLRLSWTTGGEVVEKTNGFIAKVKDKNQLIQVPTVGSHAANIKDGGFADFLKESE